MQIFNNRELGTGIWLGLFFLWAFTRKLARDSLAGLLKVFFKPRIQLLVLSMTVYVADMVIFLCLVGCWDLNLLKDTVFWFFLSGLAVVFGSVGTGKCGQMGLRKRRRKLEVCSW